MFKRLLTKKSIYAASYFALAIIIEIISFLVMGMGVFPQYFGLDLAVIFLISFIIFVIPNSVAQLIVMFFCLLLQVIITICNEALYAMSGTVFGLGMLNLAKELGGVFDSSFVNWWLFSGLFVLYFAAMGGCIFVALKMRTPKGLFTRNATIIMIIAFIVLSSISGAIYAITVSSFKAYAEEQTMFLNEEQLYSEQTFPVKAYKKFGSFGYYSVNIVNTVIPSDRYADITEEDINNYFAEGQMSESVYGDNIYTGAIGGKNLVLVVIESGEWYAINKEYTPTLYAMAEQGIAMTNYYARDKTNHSEAIAIMGSYATARDLEPAKVIGNTMSYTLPNVLKESGYTSNYFHIHYGSFYDRNKFFNSLYGFDNINFLEDLTLLKGNTGKKNFYDFDKDSEVMKYYYDSFTKADGGAFFTQMMTLASHGGYTDLIDYGNYPYADVPTKRGERSTRPMSASEMARFTNKCNVKEMDEYYAIIDSFPQTYVTGVTGIDEEYLEESGQYSEMFLKFKRFQAGITDLDFGVNMLVHDLIRDGKLDDTVFMFYADHSAYYSQQNYIMKGIDMSETYNTAVYNIPCFMWYGGSMNLTASRLDVKGYKPVNFVASKDLSSGLQSGKITKFCNTYDILPTLLHLQGYNYNLNLYHGYSMFSEKESVFVSHESGIFVDDIYFSVLSLYEKDSAGVWTEYDFDETYLAKGFDEKVMRFLADAEEFYHKQDMLEAATAKDYFAGHNIFTDSASAIHFIEKV